MNSDIQRVMKVKPVTETIAKVLLMLLGVIVTLIINANSSYAATTEDVTVKQHWIPLLDLKNEIVAFNKAVNERRRDKCYEYTARMSSKIKLMYYVLFYSLPIVFIFLTILFLLR